MVLVMCLVQPIALLTIVTFVLRQKQCIKVHKSTQWASWGTSGGMLKGLPPKPDGIKSASAGHLAAYFTAVIINCSLGNSQLLCNLLACEVKRKQIKDLLSLPVRSQASFRKFSYICPMVGKQSLAVNSEYYLIQDEP